MNIQRLTQDTPSLSMLAEAGLDLLIEGALYHYDFNSKNRTYHNATHAIEVLQALQTLTLQTPLTVAIAALWHDAVYVPGVGSNHNEMASAQALLNCYNFGNFTVAYDAEVAEAAELIRCTTVAHHLSSNQVSYPHLDMLLDADLHSLACTNFNTFIITQQRILIEAEGQLTPDYRKKSSNFLKQFLDKPSIYRTENAQARWEHQARENIKRWVAVCS